MKNKYNIMIVDDHKIFREGLHLLLSHFHFVGKIYEASNGWEYLSLIEENLPDVVLMDINMPIIDGIEATKLSKEKFPNIKIVALTMHGDVNYYQKMMELGASGFIDKNTDRRELEMALLKILNNETYITQDILIRIIKNLDYSNIEVPNNSEQFSDRELEILKLLAEGYTTKNIGEKLFISHRTVERHKENMLRRSNTNNTLNLVLFSLRHKIIQL